MRLIAPYFLHVGPFNPVHATDAVPWTASQRERLCEEFIAFLMEHGFERVPRSTHQTDARNPSYLAQHSSGWHNDGAGPKLLAVWSDRWPTQVIGALSSNVMHIFRKTNLPHFRLTPGHAYVWRDDLYFHRTPPKHMSGRWFVRAVVTAPPGLLAERRKKKQ